MAKAILVVDDEIRIRKVILRYLQEKNYILFEASNGLEALKMMETRSVDLVILDLMMPELDGEGFIRAVREIWDVYVIVLTAKTGEDEEVYYYSIGADDYIEKPFRCKALVSKVTAVFSRLDKKLYGLAIKRLKGMTLFGARTISVATGRWMYISATCAGSLVPMRIVFRPSQVMDINSK